MRLLTLKLLTLVCISMAENDFSKTESKKRSFSIFSVINFPNTQCTTLSSANTKNIMFGICQSTDTCSSISGTADGNCASGFGVCCMLSVSACGSSITQNMTYIQNPGFPSAFTTVGTCSYTINANPSICQIRLDFDTLVINPPSAAGSCAATDTLTTTSPTGYSPPVICGTNSGTHMYIETGQTSTSAARLDFTIAAPSVSNRNWKIRVQFIECSSLSKAPTDCVQYFTGVSGKFQSYNFGGVPPQILASQNYNYCIRQEEGYCTVSLSSAGTIYNINGGTTAMRIANTCININLMISTTINSPSAPQNSEVFCGIYFANLDGSVANGVVTASTQPFTVAFWSQAPPLPAGSAAPSGFQLAYNQQSC